MISAQMEYVCFWLGKQCCLSCSQCQRTGAILSKMKKEMDCFTLVGANERTLSIASKICLYFAL